MWGTKCVVYEREWILVVDVGDRFRSRDVGDAVRPLVFGIALLCGAFL